MSTASSRRTFVVPMNLGPASNFERDVFPLVSFRKKDKLSQGEFLLDATMDEMLKITSMGTDPEQWREVIETTKSRYDQLVSQHKILEERSESRSFLHALKNLGKTYSDYRAIRLFHAATKTLFEETRSRSERMRRTRNRGLLSEVPREDMEPAGEDIPPDATITHLAITSDGSMDDDTEQSILAVANSLIGPFAENPFSDPESVASSLLRDWDASSTTGGQTAPSDATSDTSAASQPSSPSILSPGASVNYNISIRNSIISPNSTLRGPTLNQGGSRNTGSRSG